MSLGECEKCHAPLCLRGAVVCCEECGQPQPEHPVGVEAAAQIRAYEPPVPFEVKLEANAGTWIERILALEKRNKQLEGRVSMLEQQVRQPAGKRHSG